MAVSPLISSPSTPSRSSCTAFDKYKARKAKWRISEATLLSLAVIRGSIGAWTGMRVWHHKTMHKKFKYGIPAILLMQIALMAYLHIHCQG